MDKIVNSTDTLGPKSSGHKEFELRTSTLALVVTREGTL
jgi:hypothetical protein